MTARHLIGVLKLLAAGCLAIGIIGIGHAALAATMFPDWRRPAVLRPASASSPRTHPAPRHGEIDYSLTTIPDCSSPSLLKFMPGVPAALVLLALGGMLVAGCITLQGREALRSG